MNTSSLKIALAFAVWGGLFALSATAENWPQFRGSQFGADATTQTIGGCERSAR